MVKKSQLRRLNKYVVVVLIELDLNLHLCIYYLLFMSLLLL